jgi:hypothetical protein
MQVALLVGRRRRFFTMKPVQKSFLPSGLNMGMVAPLGVL